VRRQVLPEPDVDSFFAEVLRAGPNIPMIRAALEQRAPDDALLVAVLRRAVPVRFLEHVGTVPPWSVHPLVLGGVVRNRKTPRVLALKLLPYLFWRDLAEAAASPWLQGAVRARAEGLLKEMIPELRLGERVTCARLATPAALHLLLVDTDKRVVEASLENPRLREEDLLLWIRSTEAPVLLLDTTTASSRWGHRYAVRLALALQPRTPLSLALGQLSSLVRSDLLRVSETPGLKPLVQAAASRVARDKLTEAQGAQ